MIGTASFMVATHVLLSQVLTHHLRHFQAMLMISAQVSLAYDPW